MTRKSKKQIQNQSQSGRSMIEMLGVLAIIAILSIGGIVGYKLAMNYYQADQIANEINLMRNDLKVKYALGNEELILGDPYDETPDGEYSGYLSTQYNRYPVDYDCMRKDGAAFDDCRETDAYYIVVANISKGVCKPLTTLVGAMNDLMYMEINEFPYKGKDLCSSDENNEIYIQFDAEEVHENNDPENWCKTSADCADNPNGSVCEENRCVCAQSSQCQQKDTAPYCDQSAKQCTACPDGGTYSNEEHACIISIDTEQFFEVSEEKFQCIIRNANPKFGPYEHTYTLYMKGHIDDWLVFYKDAQTDMTQSCPPPDGYKAKIPCLPQAEHHCDVAQPRDRTEIGDLEAGHTGTLVVYSVITGLVNHATVWGVLKE